MKKLIQNIILINIFVWIDVYTHIYKNLFSKLQEDMKSFKNYFIIMLDELRVFFYGRKM